jgi:methenyltetrahydromethanopterin cyclohydrolase
MESLKLLHDMMKKKNLNIKIEQNDNNVTIIDAGIETSGGLLAGKYITELSMGALAEVTLYYSELQGMQIPSIFVATDYPSIALLGSQFAGWRINIGKYQAIGSGPARALSMKPRELYSKIKYRDQSDYAIIILETDEKPSDEVLEFISRECNVEPSNLYAILTPTSSIAGSTQISGRIAETGIHRLVELGFDPNCVISCSGSAPIASIHPKSSKAMGRTNDMILYGGISNFIVNFDDDEQLEMIAKKAPSCNSPSYGRPFYEIFKEAEFDFYRIDPSLFAPAIITINNVRSGKTFITGKINHEIISQSLGI